MALLKRLKGATLMETMVATVLLVIIFMISSLIMNSIILSTTKANLEPITEKLNRLEYAYQNNQVPISYNEEWNDWNIQMDYDDLEVFVKITAAHMKTEKVVTSFIAVTNENK